MNNVIGRQNEVNELKDLYLSNRSEFVAIYGPSSLTVFLQEKSLLDTPD